MVEPRRVAIVGGGIAGVYVAWRLQSARPADHVTLYEAAPRLGGRIHSQALPPLEFRAELGAMRFHPMTHHLLRALIDDLGIPTRQFDVTPPHLYVRGRALSPQEILDGHCRRCRAAGPFHLRHLEQGKSPEDLIRSILKSLFNDISFPSLPFAEAHMLKQRLHEGSYGPDVWAKIRLFGMFENIPLREIGFWNLLQHYLSNEAHQLLYHSLSLESVIGNWNAAEAIPWFVSDFTGADLWMVPGGMSRVIEVMERDLRSDNVERNTLVKRCVQVTDLNHPHRWCLTVLQEAVDAQTKRKTGRSSESVEYFDDVIFAVPRSSYGTIEIVTGDSWKVPWTDDIESHHLFKVFLLYEHPWWTGSVMPGAATGRVFTDLPLRQIYYFHPDWMRKCADMARPEWEVEWSDEFSELAKRWAQDATPRRWSLVMASYSDEHHVNFWRPTRRLTDQMSDAVYFRKPQGMPYGEATKLEDEIDRIPTALRVTVRTVRKIQQQLQEIHRQTIEEPIAGVYKDWGAAGEQFGGGWHTWLIGANADDFQSSPRPAGLYFCGEVFSRDQGWIEGALRTAENVLRRFGVEPTPRAKRYVDNDFDAYVEFRTPLDVYERDV